MIRRAADFAAGFIDRLHHQPLFRGRELARILAFALVALAIASRWLPRPPPLVDESTSVANSRVDAIPFARSAAPRPRLAWVGGSTLLYDGDATLPELVRGRLAEAPSLRVYLMVGASFYDEYQAFLEARSQRPDAIIFTLNPLWLFNGKSIARWTHLPAHTFWNLPPTPGDWLRHVQLAHPGDLVQAILGRTGLLESAVLLAHSVATDAPQPLHEPAIIRFWAQHELGVERLADRQHEWMSRVLSGYLDTSESSFDASCLTRMITLARQSQIPTLLYLAPVDPDDVTRFSLAPALERMAQAVSAEVARSGGGLVHFYDFSRQHPVPPALFKDLLHVRSSAGFESQLAPLIARDLLRP